MSDKAVIEVVDENVLEKVPDFYKSEGRLFLDSCGGMTLTKRLSTKIGENSFIEDAVIPDLLDMTKKNMAIFGFEPCTYTDVKIYYAGTTFDMNAYLFEVDNDTNNYKIKWRGAGWLEKAMDTPLCKLNTGSVTFDNATVAQLITNGSYEGNGTLLDALSAPLDYYGGFVNDNTPDIGIRKEDLRIKIHPRYLLEQFFKSCRYTFESPLYDSEFGRKQTRYLLKSDFWEYDGHAELIDVKLGKTTDSDVALTNPYKVYFDSVISDPGGNMNPPSDTYNAPFPYLRDYEVCVSIVIRNNNPTGSTWNFGFNNVFQTAHTAFIPANETTTVTFSANVNAVSLELWINTITAGADITILSGSTIEYKGRYKGHYEGDIIPYNQMLPCDKSVSNLIKSESHLFNFIPITDEQTKTVTFHIPYDTEINGEKIKGLFGDKSNPKKLPGTSCRGGRLTCSGTNLLKKYYEFRFRDTSNLKVSSQVENEILSSNPFGYIAETNVENIETKKYENVLYEPVVICPINTPNDNVYHYGSHHVTNEDGISYDVGYSAGVLYYGQQREGGVNLTAIFEGAIMENILITYQSVPDGLNISDSCNLTFNEGEANLFTWFYEEYLKRLETSFEFNDRRDMSATEFNNLNEFCYYQLEMNGRKYLVRITDGKHNDGTANLRGVVDRC